MIPLNASAGIPARYANRHGLVTGATGTGKTVSLMRLAEEFSRAGVPAFVADVKGDISALARSCPATFLDLFGARGQSIRITFEAMGADLVARSLELTDAQSGVVEVAFALARDNGMPLHSIADFRDVLALMHRDARNVSARYGQVGPASIAVVQRALMRLQAQGGDRAFAGPAFDVADLLAPSRVSILQADQLMQSPRLYGAFLLWMLSDLYARLPEVGDLEKPRLVFFFDEAHLLFADASPALMRRVEQTVRLIRSKGVGVFFVTQSPADVPPLIREQLAHRLEHDRALPVGVARLATMTEAGRPAAPRTVKVDPPSCPLGPLAFSEAPAAVTHQDARELAPESPVPFVAFCLVALPVAVLALLWAWDSGYIGHLVAGLVAVFLVTGWRQRKRHRYS